MKFQRKVIRDQVLEDLKKAQRKGQRFAKVGRGGSLVDIRVAIHLRQHPNTIARSAAQTLGHDQP